VSLFSARFVHQKEEDPHPAAVRMRDLFFGQGDDKIALNIIIYRKLKP
jgi:hypothetical protein